MIHNSLSILLLVVSLLPLAGCSRSPHQRLGWKAENFFSDKGVVSLCKAIEAKDVKEIDRLVKSGVNINTKGRSNMTPLLWAFPMGEKVFKRMLELGADPNVKLTSDVWHVPLLVGSHSVTSACASPDIIEWLIHGEYFPDVPMDNYLKLVLQHGGDPNIADVNGETPIFHVRRSMPHKLPERVRLLLDAGADINHRNCRGCTPLMHCVGSEAEILCLLKAGADYRLTDKIGNDAILYFENGRMLLEKRLAESPNDELAKLDLDAGKPVFEWLSSEGVDWKAARRALDSPETMENLKNLPADYKHRPWLPQRPTLKKPDDRAKKK